MSTQTRTDTSALVAEIAATMERVRALDIEGHARAAALHCLADAQKHLEHARVVTPLGDNQRVRSEADETFRNSRRILRGVLK